MLPGGELTRSDPLRRGESARGVPKAPNGPDVRRAIGVDVAPPGDAVGAVDRPVITRTSVWRGVWFVFLRPPFRLEVLWTCASTRTRASSVRRPGRVAGAARMSVTARLRRRPAHDVDLRRLGRPSFSAARTNARRAPSGDQRGAVRGPPADTRARGSFPSLPTIQRDVS